MSANDGQIDARHEALEAEIQTNFAGITLSAAQRRGLHDRFVGHLTKRTTVNGSNPTGDAWLGEPDQSAAPGPIGPSSRRRGRFSRGLERATVVIVLLLFIGGLFVTRSLIPGGGSQQGAIGSPAHNGEIAFASDQSGVFQIYTVNADGTDLRQMTHGDKPNFNPVWSPDGRQIAYTQTKFAIPPGVPIPPDANPPISIYVMNADGSNVRDLTPTPAELSYRNLTWSPDSTQLAVDCPSSGKEMGSDQICVLNVDGSGMRRIAAAGVSMSNPSWSPDGHWIAAIGLPDGSQPYELYLLAPDGSNWRKVSAHVANFEGFTWSPDGRKIAIVQARPAGSTVYGTISIVNVDGSGQHDLDIGDEFPNDLAWSPDGNRILFQASIPGTSRSGVDIINAEGTGLRVIVPKEAGIASASWSPDGEAIAYTRYLYEQAPATPGTAPGIAQVGSEIDVAQLDGSEPVTVFTQTIHKGQYGLDGSPPAWRPMVKKLPEPTPTAEALASPTMLPGIAPWPVATADPAGLSLQLSKTTVKPGDVITRTIGGVDKHPDVITSGTLFLEVQIDGKWRWIYFLGLAPPSETPVNSVPGADTAISAVGLSPQPFIFQIPDVPPGTYRLRQDATYGSNTGPATQVTLYATITVVGD